jgi:hypothetical protein
MGKLKYESRYDVPAGTYEVEFVGVEDRKPFDGPGKYGRQDTSPRLGWLFRIISGPLAGQVIEQGTGSHLVPKSRLLALLTMMLGRRLAPGDEIDPDALKGRRYQLTWSINPDSPEGRCHITGLTPLAVGSGAAPPAPPKPLAAPPPSEGALFWVLVEEGRPPVQKSRSALEEMIREDQLDPNALLIQEAGKATGWVPASQCGFQDPNPF